MVLVKLQPYRQTSLRNGRFSKLNCCFFGTSPVVAKLGPVAYRIQHPNHLRIHHVFHVSLLKLYHQNLNLTQITQYHCRNISSRITQSLLLFQCSTHSKFSWTKSHKLNFWSNGRTFRQKNQSGYHFRNLKKSTLHLTLRTRSFS